MKNVLIATNIVFIGIIAWLLYGKPNKINNLTADDKPIKGSVCINCDDETKGQTFEHFKDVVYNYRIKHWDVINTNVDFIEPTAGTSYNDLVPKYNKTDARSIWFPLETIKKFICSIEKYNGKLSTPNKELGIRFYYAVYGKDYEVIAKRNRHTLFMVPTYQANAGQPQVDFDPRATYNEQVKSKGRFKEMLNYVMIGRQGSPFFNPTLRLLALGDEATSASMTLMQNTGEMCPANCPLPNTFEVIDP